MKLRIEYAMLERARTCADAAGLTLAEWSRRVWRKWHRRELACVAVTEISGTATRESSTVITVPVEDRAEIVRAALYAGVAYCEARMPKPFTTHLREGVDYIVEVEA